MIQSNFVYVLILGVILNVSASHGFMISIFFPFLFSAEAKGDLDRDRDKDKSKRKKKKNKVASSSSSSCKPQTSPFDLRSSGHDTIKKIIEQQVKILSSKIARKELELVGKKNSSLDKDVATAVDLATQALNIKKALDKEIEITDLKIEQLYKIQNKTIQEIRALEALKQQKQKLIDEKIASENKLNILVTGLIQTVSHEGVGLETGAAVEVLSEALNLAGIKYGKILSQALVIGLRGIKKMNETNYDGSIIDSIEYYNISYRDKDGGWMLGLDRLSGRVFIRLDTPNAQDSDYVRVIHRELLIDGNYQCIPLEDRVEKILAGEYQLGQWVSHLHPKSFLARYF